MRNSSIYSKQIFSIINELIPMIEYQKWEGIHFHPILNETQISLFVIYFITPKNNNV